MQLIVEYSIFPLNVVCLPRYESRFRLQLAWCASIRFDFFFVFITTTSMTIEEARKEEEEAPEKEAWFRDLLKAAFCSRLDCSQQSELGSNPVNYQLDLYCVKEPYWAILYTSSNHGYWDSYPGVHNDSCYSKPCATKWVESQIIWELVCTCRRHFAC